MPSAISRMWDNTSPMISYDGHGMTEQYPAGLTIAGVMSHEQGHINGAREMALSRGDTVVSEKIEIDLKFMNGRLVATGGKATTLTAKATYQKKAGEFKPNTGAENAGQPATTTGTAAQKPENDEAVNDKAAEVTNQLQRQKSKLESQILQIQGREQRAAAQTAAAGGETSVNGEGEFEMKQNSEKISRIKRQVARIDNMLASLEVAKNINAVNKLMQAIMTSGAEIGLEFAAASMDIATGSAADVNSGGASEAHRKNPYRASGKSSLDSVIDSIQNNLMGALVNIQA